MADELNKLKIRRSVIRERMNVIGGLEDISEAVIKEEKELRDEYQKLEVRQTCRRDRIGRGRQASKRGFPG